MTNSESQNVTGEYVTLEGEQYFCIGNSHLMPDFFMSLVGASDHWMFISSNGALTCGRRDPDLALFPYAADDQISAARATTGCLSLIRSRGSAADTSRDRLWEPFAPHAAGTDAVTRNLFKTPAGNKLVFEEINSTRGLAFRYRWTFSERFGFVRSCRLENIGSQSHSCELLDGLQNVLPYGVASEFMMRFSNLANAYKKNELIADSNIGLFYLSSIPTDRAEPSEGLRTTTVWQTGLQPNTILISTAQIDAFRAGKELKAESVVRGRTGAFLMQQSIELAPGESVEWHVVAEVGQDHADVVALDSWLQGCLQPVEELQRDIAAGEQELLQILSSSDAMQCGQNERRANRHLSNTVFNVMRGGIPLQGYGVNTKDFRKHIRGFNLPAFSANKATLDALPPNISITELRSKVAATKHADFKRLTEEYLPLAFSRRHGDPTRPWNRFAIHLRSKNGETNLNYQGNWRDIFQNWEALAVSFPQFSSAMICRFVNATTADGYNPYRVTKDGFEWEETTPDDPWANIGYWGDHQIIYLLKLLEWNQRFDPEGLASQLNAANFVHANIPYRIRPFEQLRQDPQSTIDFDTKAAAIIRDRVKNIGADGKLLMTAHEKIRSVTLFEKLLTLSLAKMSNFIPDGGIWLNTQRPEWNDANNALVGNGLSMVTTCYLHRWCVFLTDWITRSDDASFSVSQPVAEFLQQMNTILQANPVSAQPLSAEQRSQIVESLSRAGSDYRQELYDNGLGDSVVEISRADGLAFFETARQHIESTIRNNQRADGLFHSYNLLNWNDNNLQVEHLYEMLEGQVAVLSCGLLSATEAVQLLNALRSSALYRKDQQTYLLYPNRQLPGFLEKNAIPADQVESIPLLPKLLIDGNTNIVQRDVRGGVHFAGDFKNSNDLLAALKQLPEEYSDAAAAHADDLKQLFEDLFAHRQFTGRSGTFFAYEGLGSTYWHMVSKLGLAVAENYFTAADNNADAATLQSLQHHYREIYAGIGAEKSPADYGAFPTDPYSHTPEKAGVKQPGMTGQVKEDVLSRFAELGVHIENGCVRFRPELFDRAELLREPREFSFCGLDGEFQSMTIPTNSFAFTLCQVPIVYSTGEKNHTVVHFSDGSTQELNGLQLDAATSRQLFARSGQIAKVACCFV